MTAKYPRGTVANIVTEHGHRRAIWDGYRWATDQCAYLYDRDVTDVRPLVVLDLDGYDRRHAAEALRVVAENTKLKEPNVFLRIVRDLADAIESQTRPPKPDEPTGRYAVVEDANGEEWVRERNGGWFQHRPELEPLPAWVWRKYDDIDVVKVSSEGVRP